VDQSFWCWTMMVQSFWCWTMMVQSFWCNHKSHKCIFLPETQYKIFALNKRQYQYENNNFIRPIYNQGSHTIIYCQICLNRHLELTVTCSKRPA
jgi:hypothetical protein